ncbi:MAG: hypothetical protein ACPGES_12810, partial [Coraliomargarita sp.]
LAERVESLDSEQSLPFAGATFNSFGSNDRYVEVFLSEASRGFFDILGPFNTAGVPSGGTPDPSGDPPTYYELEDNKIKFFGNAIEASAALAGLRFNPTQNLAPDANETYWEVQLNVVVRSSESSTAVLSNDSVTMRITPENDVPSISSDSPQYRTTDEIVAEGDEDELVTPFTTINISDPDAGETQELTVTVSIEGQDPLSKQAREGGGVLRYLAGETAVQAAIDTAVAALPDGATDAQIQTATNNAIEATQEFIQPDTDVLSYTFSGNPSEVNTILQALKFVPTNSRNRVGERETVTFTVRVVDPFGGLAEISNVTVVVEAVNGAPVISNIPLRSEQPFGVAGFDKSGSVAARPFASLVITDGQVASDTGPIDDTLTFEISLRNSSKGSLAYALPDAADLPAGLTAADFATRAAGSTVARLILTGTPEQLTRSLVYIEYTLSSTFDFPLATPGLSSFDFELSDSVGNI